MLDIYFYRDGERYAYRRWAAAPRVGDEVMLGENKDVGQGLKMKTAHKVLRVVWGVEAPVGGGDQCVNIEVKRIKA